jgi:hypothetical protein
LTTSATPLLHHNAKPLGAMDPTDLATAVSFAARNTSNPGKQDFEDISRILGYLEGTQDYCLVMNDSNISSLKLYTD